MIAGVFILVFHATTVVVSIGPLPVALSECWDRLPDVVTRFEQEMQVRGAPPDLRLEFVCVEIDEQA